MSSYLSSRVVMNTRNIFRSYALQSIMIYRFIPYRVTSGGLYEHFDVWQFSCEPHFMLIYRTSDDWCASIIAGAPMSSYLSNKFRSCPTPQQSQFPGL